MRVELRIVKPAAAIVLLLALVGCWDNKDINHRSLPVVMGVSSSGEQYEIFLQIPEPVGNSTQLKIVSEKGRTITEAVDRMAQNMETQVDLLHIKVIVIEESNMREGVTDIFNYFMRVRDISPKALVAVSDEDMESFFRNVKNRMKPSGSSFNDFFEKNAGWSPQIALTRVWEVYRGMYSYTRDAVVPIIRSGDTTAIRHMGSAIIRDGKMVGRISPEETLIFNALNGESAHGKIEVMDHASVLIDSARISRRGRIVDGEPRIRIRMTIWVNLLELKRGATSETVIRETRDLLEKRFDRVFALTQQEQTDVFAFGQDFRGQLPRSRLREWRTKEYPKLRADFRARVIIENDGYLKTR